MDALLLAAGFGTRLRPLTDSVPKALLPINGVPLLDLHLDRLFGEGIERAAVNAHHLSGAIEEAVRRRADAERIALSPERTILGTGGAIAAAARFLGGDPVAVVNADALFAPPLREAAAAHRDGGFAATMVVIPGGPNPNVRLAGGRVSAIDRESRDPEAFTFTGLQLLSRTAMERIPAGRFFDVRDLYDGLIAEDRLGAFVWRRGEGEPFLDIGTPRAYLEAHRMLASEIGIRLGAPWKAGPRGRPAAGDGWIDAGARIGDGAEIARSVVMAGASVDPRVRVEESIIGPGSRVAETTRGSLVTPRRTVRLDS